MPGEDGLLQVIDPHADLPAHPKWVAPPGTSLHRYATELDLGPPGAYTWLAANARAFGFIHRYAWEAWHYETPLALYWDPRNAV